MVAAGLAIIVTGLAWVAHGTGIIQLPATDFMSKLSVWTVNGSLVAVFGMIVLFGSWRLLRDEAPCPVRIDEDHGVHREP